MKKIPESLKKQFSEIGIFSETFLKWFGISIGIGFVGGLIGTAFYKSVAWATGMRSASPWLLFLLPLAGVAISVIYRYTRTEGENTNDIIDSILLGNDVPLMLLPVIFVSTVLTHLFGGSAGREGAALQIGGSLGCSAGKVFLLDEKEERIAILSGMSAVFSALFGTPVTAAVFAIEVCSIGILHYSALVPCGIAALTAYAITDVFSIEPTHFAVPVVELQLEMVLKVVFLAVLCAFLSVLFCKSMHLSNKYAAKLIRNSDLRAFAGGCIIIVLALTLRTRDYTGGGVDIIARAIEQGQARPLAFLLKLLFTAVTLSCGFKGGEIVPTFFIGSTFGCVIGPLIGIPPEFAAAVGLISTFCGAVNCPLSSVLLSIEIFGSGNLIYFAAACFVSYMLSGYTSLYAEQKIIYSKLKAEYININAE